MDLERFIPSVFSSHKSKAPHSYEQSRFFPQEFGNLLGSTFSSFFPEKMPRLEVREDNDHLHVIAELPGVEEKDVDVSLSRNLLTIKGEKKSEVEDKNENSYLNERYYGSFLRSVTLPYEIDPDKAAAVFSKGLLTITLPKPESAQTKVHKIKVNQEPA